MSVPAELREFVVLLQRDLDVATDDIALKRFGMYLFDVSTAVGEAFTAGDLEGFDASGVLVKFCDHLFTEDDVSSASLLSVLATIQDDIMAERNAEWPTLTTGVECPQVLFAAEDPVLGLGWQAASGEFVCLGELDSIGSTR